MHKEGKGGVGVGGGELLPCMWVLVCVSWGGGDDWGMVLCKLS
jgi:hypothetical protein